METSLILNTTDWDSIDIENKFTIHSYGVNEDGDHVGLKINNFKPEFYIKLDEDIMENLELNALIDNLEILTNKTLYCKNNSEKSLDQLQSEIDDYDPLEPIDESDDSEDYSICHCLKCCPVDLLIYNEADSNHYNKPFFIKRGQNIDRNATCIVEKQDLYDGFKWDKKNNTSLYYYKFIKIVFNNIKSYNRVRNNLGKELFYPPLDKRIDNNLYY